MYYKEQLQEQIRNRTYEINYYLDALYFIPCMYTRNLVLNLIKDRFLMLNSLFELSESGIKKITEGIAPSKLQNIKEVPYVNNVENQKAFAIDELSKYNGKNGNPAYIAVNGIVYDVTNNAAWAAATHFGLVAGKDLTQEFASCHAGTNILSKLKVVGRLT